MPTTFFSQSPWKSHGAMVPRHGAAKGDGHQGHSDLLLRDACQQITARVNSLGRKNDKIG